MSPPLRRRFQTGRICLDFTHTGGDGEYAKWELLHKPADAARYLAAVIGTEASPVRSRDMTGVLDLRRSITILARTRVAGLASPDDAKEQLNKAATARALIPKLSNDGTVRLLPGRTSQALSTIARDAIDLFSSPLADRIRICEADDCGLLFVDASRPGRRRWCSMEWCGDRQKKRRSRRPAKQGMSL